MKRHLHRSAAIAAQQGLTLIELLISMTIGLVILSALTYVYVGSRGTYRVSESVARVQETGRFGLDYIGSDLRMTSFAGCRSRSLSSDDQGTRLWNITNPAVVYTSSGDGIRGFENGTGWTNPTLSTATPVARVAGDVLTVRRAAGLSVRITANLDKAARTVTMAHNGVGVQNGDLVVLANCENAVMFYVTNNPVVTGIGDFPTTLAFATSGGGTGGTLGNVATLDEMKQFTVTSRAQIMRFTETHFFIGTNAGGQNALYRAAGGAVEELIDGVEDMEIVYGFDTTGSPDGTADVYRRADAIAATDWNRVVSVRVSLLAVGPPNENVTTNTQTYAFRDTNNDGTTDVQTAADRRLRQVFTSTFALRNRVQ